MTPHEHQAVEILRSLRRIIRRIAEHSKSLSRGAGLTVPQLLCLRAIDEIGEAEFSMARLSRQVQLSPATVTGIVDRLERSAWVVRGRDTTDRRRVRVALTEAGRRKLEEVPNPLQDRFIKALQALPPGEIEQIQSVLHHLVTMMEAEAVDAAPLLDTEEVSKSR